MDLPHINVQTFLYAWLSQYNGRNNSHYLEEKIENPWRKYYCTGGEDEKKIKRRGPYKTRIKKEEDLMNYKTEPYGGERGGEVLYGVKEENSSREKSQH